MHEARGTSRVGRTIVVNCAVQCGIKPSEDIRGGVVVEIDPVTGECNVVQDTEKRAQGGGD
jgi:Icc-related predicted phosphoesterase